MLQEQQELELMTAEVDDPTVSAVKQKKTFAARWLNRAYNLCKLWLLFAFVTFVAQIVLLFMYPDKALVIPGQSLIYGGAAAIGAALVGGEKIAGNLKQNNGVK